MACLAPLLAAGGLLLVDELRFRAASQTALAQRQVPAMTPEAQPLKAQALPLAFGIRPADPLVSQLALTLKACFTSSHGESRALVASADSLRVYRVGDELPGGARLRQVENCSITVWFNGREQRLSLAPAGQRLLRPVHAHEPGPLPPTPSPRLLRKVP